MRIKVVLAVLALAIGAYAVGNCDGAGNCYVANSATGTGTGADWTNACTDFTGACDVTSSSIRGTTIWVGGTPNQINSGIFGQAYTAKNFSAPNVGTQTITIIDASAENHGTDTGWNKIYATGSVILNGPINISSDYWIFNGQFRAVNAYATESTGGGTYHDESMGYRFQINNNANTPAINVSGNHVTLEYIYIQGSCNQGVVVVGGLYGQTYTDNGINYASGVHDEYFGHSWIAYTGAASVFTSSGTNFTFEYNMFSKNHMGPSGFSTSAFVIGDVSNLIIRYNHFHNITGQAIITDGNTDAVAFVPNWYIYSNDIFWDTVIHTGTGYGLNFGLVNLTGETLSGGVIHIYNNTVAGLNVAACTSTQQCNSSALTLNGPIGGTCALGTRNCIGTTAPTGTVYNNLWWNPYVAENIVTGGGSPQWTPTGDYGEGVCAATGCTNGGSFSVVGANDVSKLTGNPFTSFNAVMGTVQWYNFSFIPKPDTVAGLTISNWATTPPGCDPHFNCESNDGNYVTRGVNGTVDRGAFQITPRILTRVAWSTGPIPASPNTPPGSAAIGINVGSSYTLTPICTWSATPTYDNCPEGTPPFNKTWTSLDKATATVDSTGKVTGVSPHNTFIRLYYGGANSGNDSVAVISDGLGNEPIAALPTGITRTGSPLAFSGYNTSAFTANFGTVFSDPCPTGSGCTRWTPTTTAQLVADLAASAPGDTIVLAAGTTYATNGQFFLPARSNPSHKWTYIVSSSMSSLPPQGTRVSPNDAPNMPIIEQTAQNINTFQLQPGSDHWWIAGIDFQISPSGGNGKPPLPDSHPAIGTNSLLNPLGVVPPDSITVDRCYIHTTQNMGHAITMDGTHYALLDSYIGPAFQYQTQGSAANTNFGPGPLMIVNNFLSSMGEDIIFGGAGGFSNRYQVQDVLIQHNLIWKDPTWRAVGFTVNPGHIYEVDNNSEYKQCLRCLSDGNVYMNNWQSGQTGNSFTTNTTTSNQQGSISVNDDITFSNNIQIGQVQGMAFTEFGATGEGCSSYGSPCQYPSESRRLNIFNNLYLSGPQGYPGGIKGTVQLAADINRVNTDWLIQHNTFVGPYLTDYPYCGFPIYIQAYTTFDQPPSQNLWVLDNVMCRQFFGLTNGSVAGGTPFLVYSMSSPSSPPYTTRFFGNEMQYFPSQGDVQYTWPTGNHADTAFTYIDPVHGNFQLSSPLLTGSDGQQTGINMAALMSHQAAPLGTCSISGTISGSIVSGVEVSVQGSATYSVFSQADGTYTIPSLPGGSFTITPFAIPPFSAGQVTYTFSPVNSAITLTPPNCTSTGNNFSDTPSATYSISGTVSGAIAAGVTMTLTGSGNGSTTTDGSGNYTFAGLAPGNYTITPSRSGYTFSPVNQQETISNANITGVNFTSTAVNTYVISGTVSGAISSGVLMTLSGAGSGTTTTASNGAYSFSGLANGTYTVTPSLTGYTFSPASRSVTISNANVTGVNFTSTSTSTFVISGTVSGSIAAGVTITLTGAGSGTTTTASDGTYSFTGLSNGSYTITPSLTGYTFSPTSLTVTINNANVTGQNFTSTLITYSVSGVISGAIAAGVTVNLTGTPSGSTTSDSGGNYSFSGLIPGNVYTITPVLAGYQFAPTSITFTMGNANLTGQNFTSSVVVVPHMISGQVSGNIQIGVLMTLSGAATKTTTTAADGSYSFTDLSNGSYTVTPSLAGFIFTPTSTPVTINNADVLGVNFSAGVQGTTIFAPHIGPTHLQ